MEVEWKYICFLNPAESQRPKPSANAKPLPKHLNNKKSVNPNNRQDANPTMEEPFADPNAPQKWAEFNTGAALCNPVRLRVDLSKENQLWCYLGHISTEARAKFTEDPAIDRHNTNSNFLDTVKPPLPPLLAQGERRSYSASYPSGANVNALNGAMVAQRQKWKAQQHIPQKPSEPIPGQSSRPLAHQTCSRSVMPAQRDPQELNKWQNTYTSDDNAHSKGSGAYSSVKASVGSHSSQASNQQRGMSTIMRSAADPTSMYSSASCTSPRTMTSHRVQMPYATSSYQNVDYRQQHSNGLTRPSPLNQIKSVAPVARMMGSSSTQQGFTSSALLSYGKKAQEITSLCQTEYLSYIQQFPYLRNSYLRRPNFYESPYMPGAGISTKYMETLKQQRGSEIEHKQQVPAAPSRSQMSSLPRGDQVCLPKTTSPSSLSSKTPKSDLMVQAKHSPFSTQWAQHQTDEQFRKQVSHDNDSIASQSKLERLIAQLGGNNARIKGEDIDQNRSYSSIPERHAATAVTASFKVIEDVPITTAKSPIRPVASPISDTGYLESPERNGV